MIKIIKDGRCQEELNIIYTVTCPSCGCVFECEDEDFSSHERSIYGLSSIDCPCCHHDIVCERSTLPTKLRSFL